VTDLKPLGFGSTDRDNLRWRVSETRGRRINRRRQQVAIMKNRATCHRGMSELLSRSDACLLGAGVQRGPLLAAKILNFGERKI
jgi:hypothetical protein